MMGVIKLVKLCILPVDRERILCQVVGSNTEKVNLFCQFICDHHCCRCLDHNAKFHIFKRNAF